MHLLSSADFLSKMIYSKKNSETLSEKTVWIQVGTDIVLVLIWVQTVFKGYQQMTKVATSKKRVNIQYTGKHRERSGSVVECLNGD